MPIAGMSTVIINVRAMDLASKPIQGIAARFAAETRRLQAENAKLISMGERYAAATAKSATTVSLLNSQMVDLAVKTNIATRAIDNQIRSLNMRDSRLARRAAALGGVAQTPQVQQQLADIAEERALLASRRGVLVTRRQGIQQSHIDTTATAQMTAATQRQIQADLAAKAAANAAALAISNKSIKLREFTQQIHNASAKMQSLATTLSSTGLAMTATFTLPMAMAGAAIAKTSVDFDKSMGNIQSISRSTDVETKRLGDSFRAMSTDLKQTTATPGELAEAFYEIQSASFYGADAETILAAATKAATAGMADQVGTAGTLAQALHAYNVGAEEAAHFTDVMVRAVDVGVFRFGDLTQQMGEFIGAAGMLKIPIEEVMAAFATMTLRGLPPSEAGTSLNRILLQYLKPAKGEKELAASFGLDLSPETLKVKGLAGAMEEMIKATNGNEQALTGMLGEARAIRGVFALGSDGLELFNEELRQIYNSTGAVDKIFATQTRRWWAQFANIKNIATDLALSIGEALVPKLVEFANVNLMPIVNSLREMSSSDLSALVVQLGALALLGPAMLATSVALNAVAKAATFAIGMGTAIQGLLSGGLALGGLAAGIGPFLIGLAALAALFLAAYGAAKLFIHITEQANSPVARLTRASDELQTATAELRDAEADYNLAVKEGNGYVTEAARLRRDAAREREAEARSKLEMTAASVGGNMTGEAARNIYNVNRQDQIRAIEDYNLALQGGNKELIAAYKLEMQNADQRVIESQLLWQVAAANDGVRTSQEQLNAATATYFAFKSTMTAEQRLASETEIRALGEQRDAMVKYANVQAQVYQQAKALETWRKQVGTLTAHGFDNTFYGLGKSAVTATAQVRGLEKAVRSLASAVSVGIGNRLTDFFVLGGLEDLQFKLDQFEMNDQDVPLSFENNAQTFLENATASLRTMEEAGLITKDVYRDAYRELLGLEGTLDGLVDARNAKITKGAQEFEKKWSKAADAVADRLRTGISNSVELGDLRGGTYGGGGLAAGANGAFEAIYRIQDVAMAKERGKGVDTDKWLQMYFPGMGLDEASAAAKEIVKKFQIGLFDETVLPYIDQDKLVDLIVLEKAAEASLKAFAESIAKKANVDEATVKRILGLQGVGDTMPDYEKIVRDVVAGLSGAIDADTGLVDAGRDMGRRMVEGAREAIESQPIVMNIQSVLPGPLEPVSRAAQQFANALPNARNALGPTGTSSVNSIGTPPTGAAFIPARTNAIGAPPSGSAFPAATNPNLQVPVESQGVLTAGLNSIFSFLNGEGATPIDITPIITNVENGLSAAEINMTPMIPNLADAFHKAVDDGADRLSLEGGRVWAALEVGVIDKAKTSGTLYRAVEAMVYSILQDEI